MMMTMNKKEQEIFFIIMMTSSSIEQIVNLRDYIGIDNYIWIYNWNPKTFQFYCVPKNNHNNNNPIAVNLSKNFIQNIII